MDIEVITRFAILYKVIKNQEIERKVLVKEIKIFSKMIETK